MSFSTFFRESMPRCKNCSPGLLLRPGGWGSRISPGYFETKGKQNIQNQEPSSAPDRTASILACENIRFSSLFAAGDVLRGGTTFVRAKRPQRRRARRNGCFRRLHQFRFLRNCPPVQQTTSVRSKKFCMFELKKKNENNFQWP